MYGSAVTENASTEGQYSINRTNTGVAGTRQRCGFTIVAGVIEMTCAEDVRTPGVHVHIALGEWRGEIRVGRIHGRCESR